MAHPWHDIPLGDSIEAHFPAFIEIPKGSKTKYELDKSTGLLRVDRVLFSAVHYPANYGFVPRTLGDDDDPLDALVLGQEAVVPMCLMRARAIGRIKMRDEKGSDDKILAVHVDDPAVSDYRHIREIPKHTLAELKRFFEDYKQLENRPVSVENFDGPEHANAVIRAAAAAYRTWLGDRHQEKGS
jgi:inorganic pyrophosphatase